MDSPDPRSPTDSWRRAVDLLHDALGRPASARRGFVERRCAGDLALRDEVLSLLAADEALACALDAPPIDLLAPGPAEEGAIGPYRIVGELGRGGGGVVYLAERADGAFHRRVAIKLLARGTDSRRLRRRLCAERQILADLEHPNIAQLYEGGTTADGRPYIVMEYVDGEPIDHHCRRAGLSVRGRLELFSKVCSAVRFAHRHRVIHRDLKPSNVLVDRAGEPRLLDFGIAKILDRDEAPDGSDTTVGPSPMTLQYASPEQVRGDPVTPATDVYALGLVLYEILAGERPFEVGNTFDPAARESICREEPPRPSAAVRRSSARAAGAAGGVSDPEAASRLARRLEGDLDSIVLTALRKEPEHRYPTVERLADDLSRHLRGLPVRARRTHLAYRAGKILRRHAKAAVAVAIAVTVLGAFAADHGAQRERADRARERTEVAAAHLAELFLFSRDAASQARAPIPREVVDRGAAFVAELDDRPELRCDLTTAVGRGYLSLGLTDEAEPFLEGAVAMRRELSGPNDQGVATAIGDLAWLRTDQGRVHEAELLYRWILETTGERLGPEHPAVASARNALAASLLDQGRYAEAEPLLREALATQTERLGDGHPRVEAIAGNLAIVLYYRGRYEEASALFRRGLENLRRHLPENDGQVAAAKINLAAALRSTGRYDEASTLLHPVLALYRSRPPSPALGTALENLAQNQLFRGALVDARRLAYEAAELYRSFHGDDHPSLARAEILLARIVLAQGRPERAEPLLRRARDIYRQGQLSGHWREAEAESLLGECLMVEGRLTEAERLLRSSHRRIREQVGDLALPAREAAERLARLEARNP